MDKPPPFCLHKQLLEYSWGHTEEIREERLGGDFIISTSPIFDSTGQLTGSVHVMRDITERKRAEEELEKILKKLTDLESIINRSPAMVFLWPVKEGWPVEFVSDNVKQILGYTADDFMSGKISWPGITHPEDVPRLEAEIAQYFEEGINEFNQEYRLIAKSGDICWMRDQNKVLFDSEGVATHIQSIVLNVTERKRAEEELKSAYQTTRNILDKAPFGIYVVNTQGHIDYVNPAMLEIAGDTYQQFKNINVIDLPTYQKLEISGKIRDGLKGKYFNMSGVKYKSYYGNKTTIRNFIGIPLKEKGERKLLMIIEDITETKQAEKALKKREGELESKTISLEEVNTALRVMLKKKDEVKTEVEEKVLSNVKELVTPYLEKLKRSNLDVKQNTYLSILESNLNDITSSFSYKLSSNYLNLTPTEIRVTNLIRHGNSTKEIAELMCLSTKTIDFHRNNIREKLGIKNQKANLRTHLTSLP
jgi:PAS domain S-box-containing protein